MFQADPEAQKRVDKCSLKVVRNNIAFCGQGKIACSVQICNVNCPTLLQYFSEISKKLEDQNGN